MTLKGQLPPFDMEKSFEAIHTTAEQLPDLERLFREDKPLFQPGTEISLFMKHIPKQQELDKFVNYLEQRVIHDCNVPLTVKELKAEYHVDPYFKDIVKYLEKDYCMVLIPHLNMDLAWFVGCCFSCSCCSINALGNVVRVYPVIVQGLTFYRSKV